MSTSSSCEWSVSDEASASSCSWSDTASSCTWSSGDNDSASVSYPHIDFSPQPEISSPNEEINLLDSSMNSEVSWTPPPTPPDNATRCSPRLPKANKRYRQDEDGACSPNSQFTNMKWSLFKVMEMNGCASNCTSSVHGLTEYDILRAHSLFTSLNNAEQRRWVYDYFSNHCPNDESGTCDPSGLKFILCGKNVCQSLWLATLAISTSRFYDLRRLYLEDIGPPAKKKPRSCSAKSYEAISWMTSYFDR